MKARRKKSSAKAEGSSIKQAGRANDLRDIRTSQKQVNAMFHKWLRRSASRLPYRVITRTQKATGAPKYGTCYQYNGVTSNLYFTLHTHTLRVHVDLDASHYDGLSGFEVYPAINKDRKFACSLCVTNFRSQQENKEPESNFNAKRPKYFDRLEGLYAEHCFERLLAWTRKNIKPSRVIVYVGDPDDARMAQIRPVRDVLKFTEPHRVIPLVKALDSKPSVFFSL